MGKGEGKVKKEKGGKEGREEGKRKKMRERERQETFFLRNLEWRARCTFVCTCIYYLEIVEILFESGA